MLFSFEWITYCKMKDSISFGPAHEGERQVASDSDALELILLDASDKTPQTPSVQMQMPNYYCSR